MNMKVDGRRKKCRLKRRLRECIKADSREKELAGDKFRN